MNNLIENIKRHESLNSIYKNIYTQQKYEAFEFLFNLIKEQNVELVIEIGTAFGGLSTFISDLNVNIITFDIKNLNPAVTDTGYLKRYIMDAHTYECVEFVKTLTENKKTLWLIDGGDKQKEFNMYSTIAKKDECICIHDFAPTDEDFQFLLKNNIWLWHEAKCENLNLNKIRKHNKFEEFWKTTVWGVFIKDV